MSEKSRLDGISRFLAFVLRHHPEQIHILLDHRGYTSVAELIENAKQYKNMEIARTDLETIVETDPKSRYSFSEDGNSIRANQGHNKTLNVDPDLQKLAPPDVLFHGTAEQYIPSIIDEGICPRTRQFVHFSLDRRAAKAIGARHGKPVVITIDAAAMAKDGYDFYLSQNGIWLTKHVPIQYTDLI